NWPRVKITPMFGRWGYFVGPRLFACFPLRAKETDLWIRLGHEDQRRALAAGCSPHRRMSASGWVECRVESIRDVGRAVRWLRRAYEAAHGAVERGEREERDERGSPSGRRRARALPGRGGSLDGVDGHQRHQQPRGRG